MAALDGPAEIVRVLVADDDPLFAEWLMKVLSDDSRIEVVGIAANGAEAVALTMLLVPDVVVMDVQMPVVDGIAAARRLRAAGVAAQIIFVTGDYERSDPTAAMEAGGTAFVRKREVVDDLRTMFFEITSLGAFADALVSAR